MTHEQQGTSIGTAGRFGPRRRRGLSLLAALTAALSAVVLYATGSATPALGTTGAGARLVSLHPCPQLRGVECGTLSVPADWTHPGSMLTVRFEIFARTDLRAPAAEPIVGMEGGPGFSSIQSASSYLAMIGPLHRTHELIVMDDRGTGASGAIDCPALQAYEAITRPGDFLARVDRCRAQLGARADDYGTVAVGDDLAFLLRRLGVSQVDVYGDSYGSFAAQAFTLDHPALVRALVLDGAFDSGYNPFETEAVGALRRSWTAMCRRSTTCGPTPILTLIARFDRRLATRPVRGAIRLAPGQPPVPVDLTASAFDQLVYDASYSADVFADLPAALHAFAAGAPRPLLRLAANDIQFNLSGPADFFSIGDLESVSCVDYPTAWDRSAAPSQRRRQLADAIAALSSSAFYPFSTRSYLDSYVENELVDGCLDWPAPPAGLAAAFPPQITYPQTPTLIFDGEFDFSTSLTDADMVARAWPHHTFVEVADAKHVTAAGDTQGCTSHILQRFIARLSAGSLTCARNMPEIAGLAAFPRSLASTPEARPVRPGASSLARRVAWAATETVADSLGAWFSRGAGAGAPAAGLYGGSFQVTGDKLASALIRLRLSATQLVPGLAVSGTATWQKADGVVQAALTVRDGYHAGTTVHLRWYTGLGNWRRPARISGELAGARFAAQMRAPWAPQS